MSSRAAVPHPAVDVRRPAVQHLPVVLSSPHSGRLYPEAFTARSRLDPLTLRRSEDSFVDDLFADASALGVPLVKALFPRAFVDVNREAYELDPEMFADPLPAYANTRSLRVSAGLGTIARVVANGAEIYRDKLPVAEALSRIDQCYFPYHRALQDLIFETRGRFGYCLLLDCHSMPSSGLADDAAPRPSDIVLGDGHGRTCGRALTEEAAAFLAGRGYRVARNRPYSGGYITRHYGRPGDAVHALQIEINRSLYMDEVRIRPKHGIGPLRAHLTELVATLGRLDPGALLPLAAE